MGLPSPACNYLTGASIFTTRHVLDRFGFRLSSLPLPGDAWRAQHDALKWRLVEDAREMGVDVKPEVYGLFAACIPQASRSRFDGLPTRKRQGLVPDLRMRLQWDDAGPQQDLLLEVKTLHVGSTTYPSSAAARCSAVFRRAGAIPSEYASKARKVDRDYCGTVGSETGPVAQRLVALGPVKGLVFGAFSEGSPDVHRLLSALSQSGARRHSRYMGADEDTARGALAWLLKRRWALTAAREAARLTLSRLDLVGTGASAASGRRRLAEGAAARARRAACAGVRGPRAFLHRR